MRLTPEEYRKSLKAPKKAKYNNEKVIVDEVAFDSKKEGKRWTQLKFMLKQGLISDLRLQVKYPLLVTGYIVNGKQVLVKTPPMRTYIADFVYIQDGKEIVEDAKGMKTKEYKRKKELMKLVYGIDIKET